VISLTHPPALALPFPFPRYTVVDAVQLAPHHRLDVAAWGCDFAFTSAYKWFGPHLSLMFGRAELLRALPSKKVRRA